MTVTEALAWTKQLLHENASTTSTMHEVLHQHFVTAIEKLQQVAHDATLKTKTRTP